jgi:hypothetical protein
MGRVGEASVPAGLEADLRAFDPDLRLRWDARDQRWTVVQITRRCRNVGAWRGAELTEVRDVEIVVLALDEGKAPDRRILPHLYDRRGFDRKMRQARILRDLKRQKASKDHRLREAFEPAKENMARGAHELRKKGFGGVSPPFMAPSGGWLSGASA